MQILSLLEHMYSDLGLIEDFEINQVVLRRFLVSETTPQNVSAIKQPALHGHDPVETLFSFLAFKPVSFDFFHFSSSSCLGPFDANS